MDLVVLVTEHLLATLASGHALLLLLSELAGRELGLLLRVGDLVAHGIESLLLVISVGL